MQNLTSFTISSGLERGLLDVDAAASEQAVYIKQLLSRARRSRGKVQSRCNMLDENGTYAFSATTDTFTDLQRFFPDIAVARLEEIEVFHRIISSVFKAELKADRDADLERLNKIKQQQFALVSYQINEEMSKLNDAIYEGSYNAPVLGFTDNGYIFFTPDDTGTGIAYKGLVVYDFAVLGLTKLPVLVHDSVVLKQISDDAIERIVELYSFCGKQVIIALDKQDSYSERTAHLLSESAVLRLANNGQELFGRSWG